MLRRKAYNQLLQWKLKKGRECLLIKGARQIGKTYLARVFGKNEYQSFIEINFLKNPELKEIFSGSLAVTDIYKRLTAYLPTAKLIAGKTLIFLDEIQKCAAARTALKFLAEDQRFDVIASGSLLGLHYGQDCDPDVEQIASIPVGYERLLTMYSMDFEEFLWALGYQEDTISYLHEFFIKMEKVPDVINDKFEALLREYIVIGGMPEVVENYVNTNNFSTVHDTQQKILAAYDDDIVSHASVIEKIKVKACYDSLPRQLAREYKKFKYSDIEKKATSRKYGESVTWLHDANLINLCHNVYEPYLPLMANEKDNEFKAYINDTGLLMARYGLQSKLAILNNTIKGNAKDGIYENLISDMLVKNGYSLHYYKQENSSMELEFLIEKEAAVVPIEVKAGNTSSISLNNFISKYHPPVTYKVITGNIGYSAGKLTIPHYMAMFI